VNVSPRGRVMFEQGDGAKEQISAEFSAVRALAAHLELTPEQLAQWLRESRGVPPQVLLSWICLWDLKRR
jgi:hypothetical protein